MSGPTLDQPAAQPTGQLPIQPLQKLGQIMQDLAAMSARQVAAQDAQLALLRQLAVHHTAVLQQLMGGPSVPPLSVTLHRMSDLEDPLTF